jgi:hypothetical protein
MSHFAWPMLLLSDSVESKILDMDEELWPPVTDHKHYWVPMQLCCTQHSRSLLLLSWPDPLLLNCTGATCLHVEWTRALMLVVVKGKRRSQACEVYFCCGCESFSIILPYSHAREMPGAGEHRQRMHLTGHGRVLILSSFVGQQKFNGANQKSPQLGVGVGHLSPDPVVET